MPNTPSLSFWSLYSGTCARRYSSRASASALVIRLERLVRLGLVLVAQHEAGPLGRPRVAHPDLAVGMQAAAARRRHGGEACAPQQPGVRHAAVGMDAAVVGDHLVPRRLTAGAGRRVGQRRAVELVLVEVGHDLVA